MIPPLVGLGLMALLAFTSDTRVPTDSGRGVIVLRLDCRSSLGRREVTLFANGTVRLREGPPHQERMTLGELGAPERDAILRRLAEIDLSESRSTHDSASGDWVERCELQVALSGRSERRFHFARYDSLDLAVDRLRRLAVEIGEGVDASGRAERLPRGYRPAIGDCLKRIDGSRYSVRGFTSDGKGLELAGLDAPLTIYVPRSELDREFSAKVPCRR